LAWLAIGLLGLAACGSDGSSGTSSGGAGTVGSSTATSSKSVGTSATSTTATGATSTTSTGQGGGACTPVTLAAFVLLDQQTGGSSLAYDLNGLAPNQEHALYIEFFDTAGPQVAGSFDLSMPPDDDYKTCAHCLLAFEDVNGAKPTAYYPESGSLVVTTPDTAYSGASAGSLDGIKLVEVTLAGTVATPVPGGKCLTLSGSWMHM
jgi:hypothetical protein